MRRGGRAATVLLVLLAVVLGWAAPAGAAGDDGTRADRVLVIGVPGLTWKDVDPAMTPQLWAMAQTSPIGAVSVRAARSTTCLLDGWATLGAGNRARVPGPDEGLPPVPLPTVPIPDEPSAPTAAPGTGDGAAAAVDTSLSHCGLQERVATVALQDPQATVRRIADDPGTARFGAEPGVLGSPIGCAAVVGRAAALAAAAPGMRLTRVDTLPRTTDAVAGLLSACRLGLVSLDGLTLAGQPGVDTTEDGTRPQARAAALARIDDQLGRLRAAVAALPGRTLVLLQGVSEVNDGRPQLHVGIASGPGFTTPGWLTSASTGRSPYLQLIDVAPTVLRALGIDEPASMNGQPLQVTGGRPELPEAVAALDRMNTGAAVHYRNTGLFFWSLVTVSSALVVAGMLLLGGRRPGRRTPGSASSAPGGRARSALRGLALVAAALPVSTYLAGLVPWEGTGAPLAVLVAAVVGADLAVVAVALLGPWRRRPLGPACAVLAATLATLVGDVVTGSTLELNGPLGYDAIVAGRFTGYGNLTFGLSSVSVLLLTAAVAAAAGRRAGRRARAVTGGTVLAVGLVTVAVIGAPMLGRDFGGVLAALPGFLLLAMLLTGIRVTPLRMVAVLGAAVVAVGTVAVLDWLRPPGDRSHLGRFVQQVLTGEAWTVISRKGQANLSILMHSPLAWMLPVAIVAAVWLVRPGGLLRRRPDGSGGLTGPGGIPAADVAVLRCGLIACLLSLVLGAAVNDSGVALPATAAALLVPLLVWLAARPSGGGTSTGKTAGDAPASSRGENADRVTVVSRGSTVWNA